MKEQILLKKKKKAISSFGRKQFSTDGEYEAALFFEM